MTRHAPEPRAENARRRAHATDRAAPVPPASTAGAEGRERLQLLNRELSLLEFNRRVLHQATDARTPLLERVKFIAIFASNLDEFFMKRVGGLKRQVASGVSVRSPDGRTPQEQLQAIRSVVVELQDLAAKTLDNDILPALREAGIELVRYNDLGPDDRARVEDWYRVSIFPVLTPLAVDPGHRFPFISNLSESLGVMLSAGERDETHFARVKIPDVRGRWVNADDPGAELAPPTAGLPLRLVSLEDIIRNNLDDLFPGMKIHEVMPFRVTRNADIDHDAEDADDLLETVETEMKQRRFARAVRLEVNVHPSPSILQFVVDELDLHPHDVYERGGLLEYSDLFEIASIDAPQLHDTPWKPAVPARLEDEDADIFSVIRAGDMLVHHPYESFGVSVERFLRAAARDPRVLAIKQTIYRTSADSPFVPELARAAESGKQVACLVELRARFEEMANVQRAQMLEKAGVHVAYGVMGLKTHAKISLVVRREPDAPGGLRCYGHIGTGNYNSRTAELYTDLGLLTCEPLLMQDIVELFNYLTGRSLKRDYNKLLVAPIGMRTGFYDLIDHEIEIARAGGAGRIVAKMNALDDQGVTEKLYEASSAGVKIDLIVRGFCCLRPGVPGLSENIRVRSIIGRFLEHSRVYHFGDGQAEPHEGKWYMGSADWMHRNLDYRVEAITPIESTDARKRLWTMMDAMLRDRRCAWTLNPDGSYSQLQPSPDDAPDSLEALGAFEWLMRLARPN
ncbi:MAG: polyphosphate kinase 1 [Phycisphaerales bacterium]|nr:MAG: polyphosphate kinase 1 [Phycisphaerales bacterium]